MQAEVIDPTPAERLKFCTEEQKVARQLTAQLVTSYDALPIELQVALEAWAGALIAWETERQRVIKQTWNGEQIHFDGTCGS
ncbi:MAG: hypothetical protein M3Q39_15960 [Actinomycetota bacterium]|nr:hypothetical protein [Actinomycetota bacterium]